MTDRSTHSALACDSKQLNRLLHTPDLVRCTTARLAIALAQAAEARSTNSSQQFTLLAISIMFGSWQFAVMSLVCKTEIIFWLWWQFAGGCCD